MSINQLSDRFDDTFKNNFNRSSMMVVEMMSFTVLRTHCAIVLPLLLALRGQQAALVTLSPVRMNRNIWLTLIITTQ